MNTPSDQEVAALAALGWAEDFAGQLAPDESLLIPARVATLHRDRMSGITPQGTFRLRLPHRVNTADFAVGDWVLAEPGTYELRRRLDRRTLLSRRTEGGRGPQLIAANVDTLFIVSSCNDDLNPARLERYLALANEAGTEPVVVLTKADQTPDPAPFRALAEGLQRGLTVLTLNAHAPEAGTALAPWCGPGRTVALVGSSGVGKSSLLNTLAAKAGEDAQATGAIRESDAKGRHTTTSRSLHPMVAGGWAIDTPGMRALQVSDVTEGLDRLFAEIAELAPLCRFRDCTHAHEPGCAVLAALEEGRLDADRLERWRKLDAENRANTPPPVRKGKGPGRRR